MNPIKLILKRKDCDPINYKKINIQIRSWLNGSVLFEYESVDNTIAKTVEVAVERSANLVPPPEFRQPELRQPALRQPEFRRPELRQPEFRQTSLRQPELRQPALRQPEFRRPEFRHLSSADLSYANRVPPT